MEKPQGFNVGKLAKRGIYTCYWGCNRHFPTIEEAQWHTGCSGVNACNQTVQTLYNASAAMKNDCSAVIGKPIVINIQSILAGRQKELKSAKDNEEFQKYLENLEVQDKFEIVETYLKEHTFKTCWYYQPGKSDKLKTDNY